MAHWHRVNALLDTIIDDMRRGRLNTSFEETDLGKIKDDLAKIPRILAPILDTYDQGKALPIQRDCPEANMFETLAPAFTDLRTVVSANSVFDLVGWLGLFFTETGFMVKLLDDLSKSIQSTDFTKSHALNVIMQKLLPQVQAARHSDLVINPVHVVNPAATLDACKKIITAYHTHCSIITPTLQQLVKYLHFASPTDPRITAGAYVVAQIVIALGRIQLLFPLAAG